MVKEHGVYRQVPICALLYYLSLAFCMKFFEEICRFPRSVFERAICVCANVFNIFYAFNVFLTWFVLFRIDVVVVLGWDTCA